MMTLIVIQVAGVPVARWSGNKSGIGYHGESNNVIVGGRTSVDLPSESRYPRRGSGRGRIPNRGRGLLPTPLFSPWPVDYEGLLKYPYYNAAASRACAAALSFR